jgi:beta-glucosidase
MTDFREKAQQLAKKTPAGFIYGSATSSWQIEGSSTSRGRSIWDDFADTPGKIVDGAKADPACDHIKLWEKDLDLLVDLGVDAYRFSFSWPRIMKNGEGEPNQEGLDFYSKLIDGLIERNIKPFATIYHWDLPSALEAKGGWVWDGIYERFTDYTDLLAKNYADRVDSWATLNEPWVAAFLGYATGIHAPGANDPAKGLEAGYRLMVASGKAIEVLRSHKASNPGVVLNLTTVIADDEEIQPAATHIDNLQNRFWLDILAGRGIGQDIIEKTKQYTNWDFVNQDDLKTAANKIDWMGVNYYSPIRIASKASQGPDHVVGQDASLYPGAGVVHFIPREPQTDMGWEIHAPSMTTTLTMISERLPGVPIFVTENGGAFPDKLVDGEINDLDRVSYYQNHIEAALDTIDLGVNLKGYFAWSLLDNLEWAEGWTKRFGIVRVEADNQTRIPKQSFKFLKEIFTSR